MSTEPQEFQHDFTLDWMVKRASAQSGLSVYERTPTGVGVGLPVANFAPGQDAHVLRLVEHHNSVVQMLLADIDQLRHGPRQGWMFVSRDRYEWSPEHPIESGQAPDAQQVRPATRLEFWSGQL